MAFAVVRNLISGLKLTILFPVRQEDFRPGVSSALLSLMAAVFILASFSYGRQEGEIYFNDMGAAFLGTALFALLFGAIVLSHSQGSLDRLPQLLTVIFSASPWAALVLSLLYLLLDPLADNSTHWITALFWAVIIIVRAVKLTFPRASAFMLIGIAAITVGVAWGASYRGYSPELFYSFDSSEYRQYVDLDQEEVYFSQNRLLEEELRSIDPGNPNETDFYFVGFAGNGDESVFGSEVTFVQERVEQTFSTTGRSVVLATDLDNIHAKPLANTHNLFRVISHVGDKMDIEDDVLFLFLTSHGSKNATIEVSLFPLQLKHLSAEALRIALDDAGIKWRVIVVSACYSGTFIEPLKTDRTIIMTAAAAQNASFGCAKDRQLTYFGEALFQDALGEGAGFLDSFEVAREAISEREASEGLSASEPQIHVGDAIRAKLENLHELKAPLSSPSSQETDTSAQYHTPD